MTSPLTPSSISPMGAVSAGTEKPYRKVIYNVDKEITTDQIEITLDIGCNEDEDWTDTEKYIILHPDFEAWLETTDLLQYDDIHYVAAHDGEAVEMGESYRVSYTEFLLVHINDLDVIKYLKDKKIIADYIIDQSIINASTL